MKTKLTILTLAALMAAGLVARAGEKEQEARKDDYPLKTCVVSDEELGGMGDVITYTYKAADGREREVRFCCKKCVKTFEKDPAKYLKILDEAITRAGQTG